MELYSKTGEIHLMGCERGSNVKQHRQPLMTTLHETEKQHEEGLHEISSRILVISQSDEINTSLRIRWCRATSTGPTSPGTVILLQALTHDPSLVLQTSNTTENINKTL